MRASWDDYFLSITRLVATRSTCCRANHGAVIVQDRAIISTGYNGAPKGIKSCLDSEKCKREMLGCKPGERYELCIAAHAEQNAICLAAKNGSKVEGSTIYVTDLPCLICAKLIINAGISKVVFRPTERYSDSGSINLLVSAGVTVEALP